jgi:charged multivesicular body protein 5
MNRLFGTKKAEAPKVVAAPVEEKKIDLVEQSKKIENRVTELDSKTAALDKQIQDMYLKLRSCRGNQRDFLKQQLVQLLKRRKMVGNQQKNYMQHQMALDNVAFTQENIQNTMEMVYTKLRRRLL